MPTPRIFRQLRADHRRVLAALDALEREVPALRPARRPRPAAATRTAGGRPLRRTRTARALPTVSLRRLVARLGRQFSTHMSAEDDSLYPSLLQVMPEARPGLDPLVAEHAELRAILASLDRLLAAPPSPARDEQLIVQWRDFAALLRIHVRKEEAVVFNVAEQTLPPGELARMESLRFPRRARARLRTQTRSGKVAFS